MGQNLRWRDNIAESNNDSKFVAIGADRINCPGRGRHVRGAEGKPRTIASRRDATTGWRVSPKLAFSRRREGSDSPTPRCSQIDELLRAELERFPGPERGCVPQYDCRSGARLDRWTSGRRGHGFRRGPVGVLNVRSPTCEKLRCRRRRLVHASRGSSRPRISHTLKPCQLPCR